MTWHTTEDLNTFTAAAGDFLRSRPAAHTIQLTMADVLRARGADAFGDAAPRFGWWAADAAVTSAFMRTPPYPVVLTDVPAEAMESLVDVLSGIDEINAPQQAAEAFAHTLERLTSQRPDVRQRLRLYRLGDLVPPHPEPAGHARAAGADDRDLVVSWFGRFMDEVGEHTPNVSGLVDDRMRHDGVMLWVVDGSVVSLAARTQPAAGAVRIGPVYTPPELRGHGYASAVTSAISQVAQGMASEVVLFTDLANLTSNAIYQRIGYQAVHDRQVLRTVAAM